jgi:hypothetical protein
MNLIRQLKIQMRGDDGLTLQGRYRIGINDNLVAIISALGKIGRAKFCVKCTKAIAFTTIKPHFD